VTLLEGFSGSEVQRFRAELLNLNHLNLLNPF
jgi:hypothetical protein